MMFAAWIMGITAAMCCAGRLQHVLHVASSLGGNAEGSCVCVAGSRSLLQFV